MAKTEIPVLNLADFLAGKPGAHAAITKELQYAAENVGFFFIDGHGVPRDLVDATFEASRRFHALDEAEKMALKANNHNIGYMGHGASISRASQVYEGERKTNLVAAFFLKRDLPNDHPDIVNNKRFRGANQWPEGLDGFRETTVAYMNAMEGLAKSMLPIYARALDLADDFFAEGFEEPQYTLRLSHYPPAEAEDNQFGLAPHTDSSFLTLLAQNKVEGLQVRRTDGTWIDAPALPGTFLVNSGDMLRRWSNHRFLSTPHRAVASIAGRDRYAIPFFFDAHADYVQTCLPSCTDADNPPRYEPATYTDYMLWFAKKNYAHFQEDAAE
ncbi:MAG: isopenicillin N synthase family oxygenase [Rhodospirillaceae bacterium]|nr:isopenicillin N synthase family oxygenase [Rhodospirillaceae bacterium]MBT6913175.1 isopenicillin N synthase family oxygenase [Rhodospirillaceae bacterium]MBT6983127.1 isopenicillin N synthase family oxygenase [Rhodospirillaceae bacterium]MBT7283947.1 isopenicillin N synthase family oxygenase [Rhodospirillaceae bacterium]MBT7664943.1 isopenicillin N synthase family oxygenase [Rhodospirillaceae bacterium]